MKEKRLERSKSREYGGFVSDKAQTKTIVGIGILKHESLDTAMAGASNNGRHTKAYEVKI